MARKRNRQTNRSPTKQSKIQQSQKMPPGLTTDKSVTDTLKRMMANDAFSNPLARIGYGTPNLMEGTSYPLTRLTNNYQLLNSLYRNNWIVRRVVDTIPEDMTRNWITLKTQVPPEVLDRLDRLWRTRRLKAQILHGLKWGRLYGGSVGLMMIDGHEDILEEPLDYDTIMPGSLKGLMIVDRWTGAYPSEELEDDINDVEFGQPKYYLVTSETGDIMRIHHSRILRFVGRELPYWEKLAEVYWGMSEVEVVYEELKKRDNVSFSIANLIFLANLRVLKMKDIDQLFAVGDQQAKQDLYNILTEQNHLWSNQGMMVTGVDETVETHQYTFAGLNDIYESFMMDVAGACQIPVTRLFGRSPAGMDATGESDLQHYYETVQQTQETYLSPLLDKLLPVMCMSELGAIPDDLDYTYNPIRNSSDKDIADLVEQKTNAIVNLVNAGILTQKTALQELRQMSDSTGMFSNITDEQIEQADDSTNQGEVIPPDAFSSIMGAKAPNRTAVQERNQASDSKTSWIADWFRRSRRNH